MGGGGGPKWKVDSGTGSDAGGGLWLGRMGEFWSGNLHWVKL